MSSRLGRLAVLLITLSACQGMHACGIGGPARAHGPPASWVPVFDGRDTHRRRIPVRLAAVAAGLHDVTDLEFAPGDPRTLYVLERDGVGRWVSLTDGRTGRWLEVPGTRCSGCGLLGLAFHPRFRENGRLFVEAVVERAGRRVCQLAEWKVPFGKTPRARPPVRERTVLEVPAPAPGHDGGRLAFGPKGDLWMALGDGPGADRGARTPKSLFNDVIRIDVDHPAPNRAYGIPKDNPFVHRGGKRPEVFAYGLHAPSRISFAPPGRPVVADAAHVEWEEVDLVPPGADLGWRRREGRHCYPPFRICNHYGTVDPVYEYGYCDGREIVGGYVYTGRAIPGLTGRYVFGDHVTGRLWAIDLPPSPVPTPPLARVRSLGRWPIEPSTFGRAPDGTLYLADDASGRILRIDPPGGHRD